MKRFSFRLEQVRRWRLDQAELEEMRLEKLHAELHGIEAAQREIAAEADRSRRSVLGQASVTAEELRLIEAFDDYAKQETRRLKAKEMELRTSIDEQRQRVLEAHRRFRLLDGLRDKALFAWTAARDKEQEELATELFLGKVGRRKTEDGRRKAEGGRQKTEDGRRKRLQIT